MDYYSENPHVVGTAEERASLFAKLITVNKSLKSLDKSGKFRSGATKYEYATEADVIEPVAEAYADAGLALAPSCNSQNWFEIPGRNGPQQFCRVEVSLLIGDPDTGAYIQTYGQSAAANGDKAPNSAFTTGLKYLLAKSALVSFGDDADSFAGNAKASVPTVSREKKSEIEKLIAEKGIAEEVKQFIISNKISWTAMTETDHAKLKEYCERA